MKNIIFFLGLAILLVSSNSCKNDLDAMAPYKESIAVYGLIDPSDSVNYIRVNRVFLGAGNANEIAQIQDSVYFKPGEAKVVVEKYWNGSLKQTYNFSETYEKPLSPGVFNVDQLIYKSTQKFKSDSSSKYFEYVLRVTSIKTGVNFESDKVKLIKDITSNPSSAMCSASLGLNCFFNQTNVGILAVANANTKLMFVTPVNCATTSCVMRMHYRNVFTNSTQQNTYYEYNHGSLDAETSTGGELMDYTFAGLSFYNGLSNSIADDNAVSYRLADSITFHFYFGGAELQLYKDINNTSGSFGQEKPIYTNMNNGAVGVFSSRTKLVVTKKMFNFLIAPQFQTNVITSQSVNALTSSPITCRLKFSGPNWPISTGC